MREALTQRLLATPTVTERVGDRVHWQTQPADVSALPYINLTLVSGPHEYTMDGDTGRKSSVVQIDSWADTAFSAAALAENVEGALSAWSETANGIKVISAKIEGSRDLDGRGLGGMAAIFGSSVDVRIRWERDQV